MYEPVRDGIEKSVQSVSYVEAPAPADLSDLVHCYWELKTDVELDDDFTLHALPDACVNVLLDQRNTDIAGITALQTTHTTLDLGRDFHYVGIQFYPGVWRDQDTTVDHYVGDSYTGDLPLVETSQRIAGKDFAAMELGLSALVSELADLGLVLMSFADQSHFTHSFRDLTGFTPGEFQKRFDV